MRGTEKLFEAWAPSMKGIVCQAAIFGLILIPQARPVVAASQANGRPAAVAVTPGKHFLFVRHNKKNGTAVTDTLVLVRVGPDGFVLRDILSVRNLSVGFKPCHVAAGKLYAMKIGDLLSIDLRTGECLAIGRNISEHCLVGARLYSFFREGDGDRLRVYDFEKGAWRDFAPLRERRPWAPFTVSPDERKVAWFDQVRTEKGHPKYRLCVLDIASGTVRRPCEAVHYIRPMDSSNLTFQRPVWIALDTVLFRRTKVPPENLRKPGVVLLPGTETVLCTADVNTGQITDLLTCPTEVRAIEGGRGSAQPVVRLWGGGTARGRYRVDVAARRLVEDDLARGAFRAPEDRKSGRTVLLKARRIGRSLPGGFVSISPCGTRAIWTEGPRRSQVKLNYCDQRDGTVRTIWEGWIASSEWEGPPLWVPDEALGGGRPTGELSPGWTAFAGTPWPAPRPPDTRPDISDFLELSVSTDKARYRLHEPVQVTLTVRNVSKREFEVFRPRLDARSVQASLHGPGWGTVVDYFYGSEERNPIETATLQPGASTTGKETLETGGPGKYRLTAQFRGIKKARPELPEFRGRSRAAPASFTVEATPDAEVLLRRKMERLLRSARAQQKRIPGWDGWLPAMDAMRRTGPALAPYLVDALRKEDEPAMRRRFGYVLVRLASPAALPYFRERLVEGATPKDQRTAADGLYELCARNTPARAAALSSLLDGLNKPGNDTRKLAANTIRRIHDPLVKAAFERIIADEDKPLVPLAARYLAAYEGLDLAEWLGRAAKEPTAARYAAFRQFAAEIRKDWGDQIESGPLLEATWKEVSADLALLRRFQESARVLEKWARENQRYAARFFDRDRHSWPRRTRTGTGGHRGNPD